MPIKSLGQSSSAEIYNVSGTLPSLPLRHAFQRVVVVVWASLAVGRNSGDLEEESPPIANMLVGQDPAQSLGRLTSMVVW